MKSIEDRDVIEILRAYPQIYQACHVAHRTRSSSPSGLTSRDAGLLAHIAEADGCRPAALARHLGISPSTLSAALARLGAQAMVAIEADPADARRRLIRLTPAGHAAIGENNVLDPGRVASLLARMSGAERRMAVDGLKLLARAARLYREGGG